MREAPFGHDASAAADDAGDALGGKRHVRQAHPGVDGEIVDALLGLFDQGVAENLPGQVFGDAADLFQRLIDRHGADRDGRIAHDPFAGVMNVAARAEVHHGVRAPADRPDHLVDFGSHIAGDGRVADVGVDLDQEIAPDRHRLALGVVDVGGDDRPAARDFLPHEFRRDIVRNFRAEALAIAHIGAQHLAAQVFAGCDIFHLGRNDAAPCIMHLAEVRAGLCTQHLLAHVGECGNAARPVRPQLAVVLGPHLALCHLFHIAARQLPCRGAVRAGLRKCRSGHQGRCKARKRHRH